ncbi:hypothetical protein [Flavobacterium luteum]|uniref:Uncharacterized protein n=1 Tax=Flavobacterium luteum TaxID=2026654 RepID=A0A7J5AKW2_9FLAO|nr:hypothetical protein [Flavobacterium luteum]KAB1157609.1 hypothetical protein F6464_00570 [Flavobacterium luteum]
MNWKSDYFRLIFILAFSLVLSYDNFMAADTKPSESEQKEFYFKAHTATIWEWIQFKKEADTLIVQAEKKIKILDKRLQKNDTLFYHHLSADLKIIKQKLQIRNEQFIEEIKNLDANTVQKTYEFEKKFTKEIQSLNTKLNKN